MAKKDKNVISITADTAGKAIKQLSKVLAKGINQSTERDFIILEAQIKDDFCHFKYEIISGVGKGFEHGVKGDGIILDDMRNAFAQFNVHLAFMDDVFKHSDIEILDIDQHHGHELTGLYHVTGFKIKGDGTFDSIVLRGNKYVSGGGRIEFETPKAALDNLSSYKWWDELKAAADAAREEVALYMEGKYELAVDDEEEEKDAKTGNLFAAQQLEAAESTFDDDADFKNAALD